ncbi:basic amino acid ABC transporter substrate-binding protein [Natronomonas sp. EA1]|uniref:basic amino acid ABC transporter substrate-binding protein n=1 Tax=Natronomonas sp. EA1 TaxID=3421655 RepID=UPI003EB75830
MAQETTMERRAYLAAVGAATAALAGCTSNGGSDGGNDGGNDGGSGGNDGGSQNEDTPTEDALPEKVVIGSDIPYRPFEYETAAGELKGFDVDIARSVFDEQLGVESEFEKTSFDTIIASLNQGNFRVIMSAMTITEERAEKVDFSDPYFSAYQTIIVRTGSPIDSKEDLRGKTVGVQKGTTGLAAAEELKAEFDGNLELKKYDQITGAFDALLNGQVDAVINDNTVNAEFVNNEDGARFVEGEGAAAEQGQDAPPYLTLSVENYGIAFRKDDDAFRKKVNEALAAIKESGTYDEIYAKYFSG